jgi:hypothetical protein
MCVPCFMSFAQKIVCCKELKLLVAVKNIPL